MTNDYEPIACGVYDRVELAIMRAQPVQLSWTDDTGREVSKTVTPLNTATRNREEFLMVRTQAGETLEIRMDRLRIAHSDLP